VALEAETRFLKQAIAAELLDPEKGNAALTVYRQLRQMGAQFTFGQFLVDRGLLSTMALQALENGSGQRVRAVHVIGDFELLQMLGEGQSGSIFRARQRSLGRDVALKILNSSIASDPESLQRFQNEARATARFSHPNIVQGIDVGSDQGLHYFAMEFIDGGSVRDLLKSLGGRLPEVQALNIALQVAEGLKAAHAAGFLHRDVKPDNILLTTDGQAKLADLGISQSIGSKRAAGQEAEFWASPPYAAPEVIQGFPGDARSDVYSLGATLYEMLAGLPPYVANTPEEILRMHVHAAIPEIKDTRPDIDDRTSALVTGMLAKTPAERIPNAGFVIEAIVRIMDALPNISTKSGLIRRYHGMMKAKSGGNAVQKPVGKPIGKPMIKPGLHRVGSQRLKHPSSRRRRYRP
jgi:serine/threonine protein kinase